jgi:MscS family membrane protein
MKSVFSFLQHKVYHNTVMSWLTALAILTLAVILARLIYLLISWLVHQFTKRTATELDDMILKRIDTPVALGVILVGFRLAVEQLTFSRPIENYLQRGFVFMSAITITWLLTRIVRAGIEFYFKQNKNVSAGKLDEQMMMLAKRTSVIILWSLGTVVGLNNAGFDVGALIAGLGIGGLALALAAQDTVKNIIGGLVIFIDKPFFLGDVIRIKDIEGTVNYTGIRSTRIRTGAGRVVTIPNAHFTDNPIENISLEPSKRIVTYLPLVYETPAEKIDEAIAILRSIVEANPDVNAYESHIFLEKFNASSVDINFTYFIKKGSDIHSTQTEVNKQVLSRFRVAGIEFAYPTQTVYEKK